MPPHRAATPSHGATPDTPAPPQEEHENQALAGYEALAARVATTGAVWRAIGRLVGAVPELLQRTAGDGEEARTAATAQPRRPGLAGRCAGGPSFAGEQPARAARTPAA